MTDKQQNQTVWIARHGSRIDTEIPDWDSKAQNPYDPWLSPRGIQQAHDLGRRLRSESIGCIYSSPFLRTIETANILARELGVRIRIEHGLCEWLNGEWFRFRPQVMSAQQAKERFPVIDTSYHSCTAPGFPETWEQCSHRCAKTAWALAEQHPTSILLVGHGASVVAAAQGLSGCDTPMEPWYCSLTKVVRMEKGWVLELNADVSHLTCGPGDRAKGPA